MTISKMEIDFPGIQTKMTNAELELLVQKFSECQTLSMGPHLVEFEIAFAKHMGTTHALGVSSCTAALELAAVASGVGEGDDVLLPAHTFTATAIPFLRAKCNLIFVDLDPETFVMDVEDLKSKITDNTKVIVPVHLYGVAVDMDPIMDISLKRGITVIEDCAQAIDGEYKGKKLGSIGHFGCYSFHSQKNITTLGEGGMLTLNDEVLHTKLKTIRKIGAQPFSGEREKYWIPAMSNIVEAFEGQVPHNFAMSEAQAIAGNILLCRLTEITKSRKNQYNEIVKQLAEYPEIRFQKIPDYCEGAYHLLPASLNFEGGDYRDDFIEMMVNEFKIKTVVQYYPLYNYDLFIKHGYGNQRCENADVFYNAMVSFPFWTDMDRSAIDYLVQSIKSSIESLRLNK